MLDIRQVIKFISFVVLLYWRHIADSATRVNTDCHNCSCVLLQQGLLTACISPQQIYTESLLCSGVEGNIQLAAQHLSLSSSFSSSSKLELTEMGFAEEGHVVDFKLLYDASVDLVVGAAKEYFNSATSLMDKDMDLAR